MTNETGNTNLSGIKVGNDFGGNDEVDETMEMNSYIRDIAGQQYEDAPPPSTITKEDYSMKVANMAKETYNASIQSD
ncbi:hypothetical protein HAX54_029806, partial [Datura stramonium]|nr:hypothetical protein [Datura stramonium]